LFCLAVTGVLFRLDISSLSPELFYRGNQLIFSSNFFTLLGKDIGKDVLEEKISA